MGKIAIIKDFSNMEENGIYYVEGMSSRKINGKSMLAQTYYASEFLNENDTNMSNFTGSIEGFSQIDHEDADQVLAKGSGATGLIFSIDSLFIQRSLGSIHSIVGTTSSTPDVFNTTNGDIFTTQEQNVLYPTQYALGYGIRGRCSGTSATSITDEEGRNFSTLGLGTSSWNNKVVNLATNEEFEITSINNNAATNDRLNFTAGTETNTDGDYFMAFSDIGALNGSTYWDFFTTTAYPHFKGQELVSSFVRQIKQFDTDYLIGNGNYLAALNINETTWNDNFKQLPKSTQFKCMDVNQDRVLVGGDFYGAGRIMMWDGFSDGWLSIVEMTKVPSSIIAYKTGWLVFAGNTLYFSNGYTLDILSIMPDMEVGDFDMRVHYNGMKMFNNDLYLASTFNLYGRMKESLYVYEFGSGWSVIPVHNGTSYPTQNVNIKAIQRVTVSTIVRLITSFSAGGGATNTACLNNIYKSGNKGSGIFRLDFDEKINFKKVVLKLATKLESYRASTNTATIRVAYGNGNKTLQSFAYAGAGCTTTSIVNSGGANAYTTPSVGDQVVPMEGDEANEITYVTAIANAGTSSETWTVSPALSSAPTQGNEILTRKLKLSGSKTYGPNTSDDEELWFDLAGVRSDALWLQVYIDGNGQDIYLTQIDIYGD